MIELYLFEQELIKNLDKTKNEQNFLLSDLDIQFEKEFSKLNHLNDNEIIEEFNPLDEIKKATKKIEYEAKKVEYKITSGIRNVANGIKNGAQKEFNNIKNGFTTEINKLKDTVEREAKQAVNSLKKEANKAAEEIKKDINGVINEFKKKAESIEREAKKKVDSVTNTIQREVTKVANNIRRVIEDALRELKGLVAEKFNEIKNKVMELFNSFKNKIEELVQKIKEGIEAFGEKVKDGFNRIMKELEKLKDTIVREINEFIDLIKKTAKKIIDEIEEKIGEIKDWIIKAVEKAKEIGENIYKFTTGVMGEFFKFLKAPQDYICRKYEEKLGYDCRTFKVFLICTFIFIIMENTPIGKIPCMFGEIIVIPNFCFYLWLFISALTYYHKIYKHGTKKLPTRPLHEKIINDFLCPKIKSFTFIDCSIWLTALYLISMFRLYQRIPFRETICNLLSDKIMSGICLYILIIFGVLITVKRHLF